MTVSRKFIDNAIKDTERSGQIDKKLPSQKWQHFVSASELLREWLKYSYGVFEEVGGFAGDPVYPAEYRYGGHTVVTRGCEGETDSEDQMFCGGQASLNTLAPTKQNLECRGETARQIIFSSQHLASQNSLDWSEAAWAPPRVTYLVPGPNHYSLVLDLSQSLQDRWDPVRKSLFR